MRHTTSIMINRPESTLQIDLIDGARVYIGRGWQYWRSGQDESNGITCDGAEGWVQDIVDEGTWIEAAWTEHTGGNVWCDTIALTSGWRIIIADDAAYLYQPGSADDDPTGEIPLVGWPQA